MFCSSACHQGLPSQFFLTAAYSFPEFFSIKYDCIISAPEMSNHILTKSCLPVTNQSVFEKDFLQNLPQRGACRLREWFFKHVLVIVISSWSKKSWFVWFRTILLVFCILFYNLSVILFCSLHFFHGFCGFLFFLLCISLCFSLFLIFFIVFFTNFCWHLTVFVVCYFLQRGTPFGTRMYLWNASTRI